MKGLFACAATLVAFMTSVAASAQNRSPKNQDLYFIENDMVYRRFLALMRDGSYRQINQMPGTCTEADRGTWTRNSDNHFILHSTFRGLRFRALLSGPLDLVLDNQETIDALPNMAAAIRRFLDRNPGAVFDAGTAAELTALNARISVDTSAGTFTRDELHGLASQIDDYANTEKSRSYTLAAYQRDGLPLMLIQNGAVFQAKDIDATRRAFGVGGREAPPFYFAQVDAQTFARAVGVWTALTPVGGSK